MSHHPMTALGHQLDSLAFTTVKQRSIWTEHLWKVGVVVTNMPQETRKSSLLSDHLLMHHAVRHST